MWVSSSNLQFCHGSGLSILLFVIFNCWRNFTLHILHTGHHSLLPLFEKVRHPIHYPRFREKFFFLSMAHFYPWLIFVHGLFLSMAHLTSHFIPYFTLSHVVHSISQFIPIHIFYSISHVIPLHILNSISQFIPFSLLKVDTRETNLGFLNQCWMLYLLIYCKSDFTYCKSGDFTYC